MLRGLQQQLGLAMLFISHDLAVAEYLCDRVIVLYLGRIMEMAPREALYAHPARPYIGTLLAAVPQPDPASRGARKLLQGEVPSVASLSSGCAFCTRCPHATASCAASVPALREVAPGHCKA